MANYRELVARLSDLKSVPSRCAKLASVKIAELISEEFDRGADPYGEQWAELAEATIAKGRENPPLTDTSDMRDDIQVRPTSGAGIEITVSTQYAKFHQTGTKNMPKRRILPDGSELPESWHEAISVAFSESLGSK